MRIWILTWGAALAVAISGCASKQQTPPAPSSAAATAQPAPQPRSSTMCPMMVDPATTRVTTSDTSDGVAVAFTTTSDVNELRARVRHMADMHNQVAGMREGATGGEMPRHEHMKARHMVPSRATAEDIPGGARMVLVPADPSQLAALRDDARTRADMMQKGQCPMMAPERA